MASNSSLNTSTNSSLDSETVPPDLHFKSEVGFGDDGDTLFVLDGFTAIAGSQVSYQNGSALIVIKDDYQTLYNGYLIDTCTGDEDDSTYRDSVELWQNEIALMSRPIIDSPADFNFTAGTADMEIIWHPDSPYPDYYEIHRNGTLEANDLWNGSAIALGLGDVAAGVYEYRIRVYDITGNFATDVVIVTVFPRGLLGGIDPLVLVEILRGVRERVVKRAPLEVQEAMRGCHVQRLGALFFVLQ